MHVNQQDTQDIDVLSGAPPPEVPEEIGHACADDLSAAVQEWQDRWAGRDDPGDAQFLF